MGWRWMRSMATSSLLAVACDPCENDRLGTWALDIVTVDADGQPIVADSVTWSHDTDAPQDAVCHESLASPDEGCTRFIGGGTFDDGTYEVVATLCGLEVRETVEVRAGYCDHVETESVELVVDPSACD